MATALHTIEDALHSQLDGHHDDVQVHEVAGEVADIDQCRR